MDIAKIRWHCFSVSGAMFKDVRGKLFTQSGGCIEHAANGSGGGRYGGDI